MKFRSAFLITVAVLGISGIGFGTNEAHASTDLDQQSSVETYDKQV